VLTHVSVSVRDGTLLGCDLSLPGTTASTPASGGFPAVFFEYTPYHEIRAQADSTEGELFSTHGYAALTCDIRGTGASQGQYAGCCARGPELQDGYDVIEWMARQAWSNGRVGMEGDSYGGLTSLGVAALHPPHLTAISPQQPPSSLYRNYVYPGGMKTTPGQYDIWPTAVTQLSDRPELGAQAEAEWLSHPDYDAYWQSMDYSSTLYPKVTVPDVLIAAGQPDNYFRDALDDNYASLVTKRIVDRLTQNLLGPGTSARLSWAFARPWCCPATAVPFGVNFRTILSVRTRPTRG
jgi:uncharacterized protein